jgi:hypothetical protein
VEACAKAAAAERLGGQSLLGENMVESVVSDLEGLKTTSGFEQLLNRIEEWCSPGSGSMLSDQTSDNFQVSGFVRRRQGRSIPAGLIPPTQDGLQAYVAGNSLPHS